MKQKLLFFFLTAGGGELWADDYELSNTDALCIKSGNSLRSVNYSQVSRQFGSNGPVIIYSSTLTSGFTVNNEVIKFNGNQTPIKDPAGKITITNAKSNISSVEITFSSTGKDIPFTCNDEAGTITSGSINKTFTVNNSSCDLQFTIPASEGNTNYYLVITSIMIHTAGNDGDVTPIAVDASFANSTITCEPSSGTITNELTISSPSPLFEPTISYAISGDAVGTVNDSSGEVTMGESTGSATVTATITPPNTTYYTVTNKTYTLTSAINSFAGTYPYTWDFTTGWGVTAEQLNSSSYWGDYDSTNGIVVNQTNIADEFLWTGNSGNHPNLGKTYGIKFTSTKEDGTAKRISLCPGSYVQIQNGVSFKLSSLSKGQKITIETSESNGFNSVTNATLVDGNYVVSENGDVIFDVSDRSNSGVMKITRITISKPTLEIFRLEGTNELTRTYDASNLKIGRSSAENNSAFMIYLDPNVATALETKRISSDLLHVTVDDESVVTVSDVAFTDYNNDTQHRQRGTFFLNAVKPGTTNINLVFDGNDTYEAKTVSFEFTLNKASQSINYPNSSVSISYGGTIDNTLTVENNPSVNTITYASNDTHVATVDSDGKVTVKNAGTCTITATLPGNDYYEASVASYTLTVTGSQNHVLTWDTGRYTSPEGGVTEGYGNTYWNRATCSTGTVKYRIDDPSIATISVENDSQDSKQSLKIVPKSIGSTTVRAYVESSGDYNGAELTFTLTVNKGVLSFQFDPTSGTVKKGLKIAPRLIWPSDIKLSDILSISAVSDNTDVATIPSNLNIVDYETRQINPDGTIIKRVFPVITASSSNTGVAKITVTFESNLYETVSAEYTLTVEDTGESLGSWTSNVREYTLYTDDFMKMPEVTSSGFSGNFNYSVGSINESSQNYLYDIKSGVKTFNNKDWKRGEGVPDFIIENNANSTTGEAYIFWIKGGSEDEAELFIYAKQAGDVILKARDSQTEQYLPDITIHIREKSEYSTYTTNKAKDGATGAKYVQVGNVAPSVVTTWTNGKKFPFTWDFTNIESISDPTNCYWIKKDDTTYSLGFPTTFNYDYADIDNNNNTFTNNEVWYKPIHLTEMEGMTIWIGNNATGNWKDKNDKVRIQTKSSNDPCLYMNGGNFKLTIPNNPSEGQPDHYKVFVKVAGNGGNKPRVIINVNGTTKLDDERDGKVMETQVVSADVNSGEPVILTFNNVKVYWIAFSTEAKNLSYFKHSNSHLTYAAAAYSYPEDLDLTKSNEVNGATAYYASSFTTDNDAQGAYTNEQEQQYAVVMKPLTNLGTYVTAGTGMLLKYDDLSGIDVSENDAMIPFYMIANPRNVETYSAAETITGEGVTNYLVGTGANAQQINGRGTDYTNFLMAAAYKYYTDVTDPNSAQGGYRFDRDWSFYPVMNSGEVEAQKSYLHIPANLYVDKNGKIVDMPSSSRRTAGESAEAPASKAALAIVFDDELSNGQGTTGISTVATETTVDSDAWYTLQGVRVETPTKGGIYIHKGRKIVVK